MGPLPLFQTFECFKVNSRIVLMPRQISPICVIRWLDWVPFPRGVGCQCVFDRHYYRPTANQNQTFSLRSGDDFHPWCGLPNTKSRVGTFEIRAEHSYRSPQALCKGESYGAAVLVQGDPIHAVLC